MLRRNWTVGAKPTVLFCAGYGMNLGGGTPLVDRDNRNTQPVARASSVSRHLKEDFPQQSQPVYEAFRGLLMVVGCKKHPEIVPCGRSRAFIGLHRERERPSQTDEHRGGHEVTVAMAVACEATVRYVGQWSGRRKGQSRRAGNPSAASGAKTQGRPDGVLRVLPRPVGLVRKR